MSTPYDPYQPPAANVDDIIDNVNPQAESIRKEHLNHEASIKSVGSLYYLTVLGLAAVGLVAVFSASAPFAMDGGSILGTAVILAMAAGFFMLARGLRRLQPWVRIPAVLFSILGLFGFPFGTLINGYIIWLILSKKGRLVLSTEYAAIVAATPHIKYRTSIVIWILLGLILLLVLAAIVVPMFGK